MDREPCPCVRYHSPVPVLDPGCEQCSGTGLVDVDSTVRQHAEDRATVANSFAAPALCVTCTPERPCDPPRAGCIVAPPCCYTPQLCGGPHEGCRTAADAVAAGDADTDTTAGIDTDPCDCDATFPAPCP
ncbi:hypothetical protein [Streptomyces sp. S1]|uniref:hypothetical protein n=1 Tax=Streptomyces sp. S1 TaxID=718288 RepID=UPI003D754E50